MIWINGLSQIFFAVFVTSVTGTIMFLIWFLCRIFLQNRNPKLVYYMLRWVVIMYLLPITYVSFAMHYDVGYVKVMQGKWKMFFALNMDSLLLMGLMLLWFILFMIMLVMSAKNEVNRYRICKNNFEDGASLAQTEFERVKEILGIKGKVELYRNDDVRVLTPFVTGFIRRKVVVPYRNYSLEELKVIMYHELNHVKQSDIVFRYLTMLAIIVNCMNPISYLLWKQVLIWSEADCDARAVDGLEKEGISKKQYYETILIMQDTGPEGHTIFYNPMLWSAESSMYRRIEIMEKYTANMKKMAKSVTFAWVMVFAMFSTVTAHAAGLELAKAGDKSLIEAEAVDMDGGFAKEIGWSDEMEISSSDAPNIMYINDGIMTLGEGTFTWDVPAGTRGVGSLIYLTKGTVVQMTCTATPSHCIYWFGLMKADNSCIVVEGSGSGAHDFTVPANGYYRIMVENRSIQSIHAIGAYQY